MKRINKWIVCMVAAIVMFDLGYCTAVNVRTEKEELQAIKIQGIQEKVIDKLTDTVELNPEEFLEKYVYGKWKFSKRVGKLDEDGNGGKDYRGYYLGLDLTDEGAEEMKNIVVEYEKDSVTIASGLNRNTFSHFSDMYVLGVFQDGFNSVRYPEYRIEKDMYIGMIENYLFEDENYLTDNHLGAEWVWVRVSVANPDNNTSRINGYGVSWELFIDLNNPETIYADFCGLWELKREEDSVDIRDRGCPPDLTDEEREFLEKHVYGEWELSRQLYRLEDENDNFSQEGIERLVQFLEIKYTDEIAENYYWQFDFRSPQDVYLYAIYGGCNNAVLDPVYHVWGEADTNHIRLRNVDAQKDEYIQFTEKERLIEVTYDLGYDTYRNSSYMIHEFGSHMYIDPEDDQTIYLDFVGLWELKRREKEPWE